MTTETALEEIRQIRQRLDDLEARLRRQSFAGKSHTFGDLRGMLKDDGFSSDQEIERSLYQGPKDVET